VRDWSYMKFPFLKDIGTDNGWYRVGPLARVNVCDYIDSPLAEAERKEFMAVTGGKPNNITLAYHWARMIETLYSIEKIRDLLHDSDLQGNDLLVKGDRREEGVGIIEAPRGTLFHHYKVDANDQITMANLIVSTTNAIRAYDPCLSCATHAMGQMPLTIELYDNDGTLLDRKSKD